MARNSTWSMGGLSGSVGAEGLRTSMIRSSLNARARPRRDEGARERPKVRRRPVRSPAGPALALESVPSSADHDLVGQRRAAVGQVEHGLLRQLLGMIGPRAALEDDRFAGADHMEIANP